MVRADRQGLMSRRTCKAASGKYGAMQAVRVSMVKVSRASKPKRSSSSRNWSRSYAPDATDPRQSNGCGSPSQGAPCGGEVLASAFSFMASVASR
jgi:hypothetical protein